MESTNKNIEIEVVSPGKILLCGGYLILNPSYRGLSLAVDSFFSSKIKCSVSYIESEFFEANIEFKSLSENYNEINNYNINVVNENKLIMKFCNTENPFISSSILAVIYYLIVLKPLPKAKYTISMMNTLKGNEKFYTDKKGKTGLGSSSALLSSLCTSIYYILSNILDTEFLIQEACLITLYANSIASGKIGSGFDILTCFKGTIIFQQIQSKISHDIVISKDGEIKEYKKKAMQLSDIFKDFKNYYDELNLISLENIHIKLICNFQGSNTRILSKEVVEWINSNGGFEGNNLIKEINFLNEEIIELFLEKNYTKIKEKNFQLRKKIQMLSKETKVEIEPEEMTEILDKFSSFDSCIYCIIPGAGGYDGICCIFLNEPNIDNIINLNSSSGIKIIKI